MTFDPVAHKVTMFCTAVLFFKFFVTTLIQGRPGETICQSIRVIYAVFSLFQRLIALCSRAVSIGGKRFAGGTRPPEDATLSIAKQFKAKQTYGIETHGNPKHVAADIRWQRIVHNDLENIFPGLLVAWASLQSVASVNVHCVSIVAFTVARVFHTVTYAYEMQPARAIAWSIAAFAAIIMCLNGCIGLL